VVEPTRYAERLDGSLVAYRTAGDGPIDLVFSVGVSNCEVLWDHPASARFLDRLASFSRLIVFDFRGSGASDDLQSPGFPTWEDWADDLHVVLDQLGSKRCAFFVLGSAIPSAIVFATTYPERTSALVLYQAPLGPPDAALVEAVREYIRAGWGSTAFARGLAPSMADDQRYIDWVAKTQRLSATPRLAAAQIAHYMSFDATDLLGLLHSPTLVLHQHGPLTRDPHGWISRISEAHLIELEAADELLFGTAGSDVVVDHVEEFLTGVRPAPLADRVLATVLFTDIVGSTDRAARLGDQRWRSLLDTHDACVREHIEYFRGRLVKTTGDGAFATFDGPARGIRCAKALRQALSALDIEIRAGLHTGEVELRQDDVGGIAVHIGARVAAMARAGEILVSSTVKELVVGSDLRFKERGLHTLKGVPEDWRLFRVE
jgi:class 3 adenylate cyclase